MRMSTQFTVSVQIMILIAISNGRKITSDMISQSTGCNPVMVRQQFTKLKEAGLLNVSAGRGATTLAKGASDITLWDIFAATEGSCSSDLFAFHPNISKTCKIGKYFEEVLGNHLDDAVSALRDSLGKVSLASLIEELTLIASEKNISRD